MKLSISFYSVLHNSNRTFESEKFESHITLSEKIQNMYTVKQA